jgi:hypothetical protein
MCAYTRERARQYLRAFVRKGQLQLRLESCVHWHLFTSMFKCEDTYAYLTLRTHMSMRIHMYVSSYEGAFCCMTKYEACKADVGGCKLRFLQLTWALYSLASSLASNSCAAPSPKSLRLAKLRMHNCQLSHASIMH